MRTRNLVAIVLLLAPAALSAQRIPLPVGRRGPGHPEPLPPQPTPIAQQLAYTRSHLSIESYPMVSFIRSPGLGGPGRAGSWASIGAGTHADYRLTRFMAGTVDLTSTFYGGPVVTETAEVGTRFSSARGESRWYPFLDLRLGYIATRPNFGTLADVYVDPSTQVYYGRYAHGFGGVAGGGVEYALTRMFSLTTSVSALRTNLTMSDYQDPSVSGRRFGLTSLRYTIGLRFNPVHTVYGSRTDARAQDR